MRIVRGSMERVERAFRLLRASWEVLKKDRELIVLPVVSGVITLVVAGSFVAAAWGTGGIRSGQNPSALSYLLLALFYFCAYLVGIFFNAAVVAAAMIRLKGGDPTLEDGLRAARAKLGPIVAWVAIAATVGMILRGLEEKACIIVRIVGIGGLVAIGATMSGIFNAALYRFATTGEAAPPFDASDLQGSFRQRRRPFGSGTFGGFGGGFSGR